MKGWEVIGYTSIDLLEDIFSNFIDIYKVENYPKGITVEELEIKPADEAFKYRESTIRVLVDGVVAFKIYYGGKHGDTVKSKEVLDKSLTAECIKRFVKEML